MSTNGRLELDDLDRFLLNELQNNSKIQVRELSEKTNKALGTISTRVKKLVDNNIIRNYTVSIDPQLINLSAMIKISIDVKFLDEVNHKLQQVTELACLWNTTGQHDIIALARFTDINHLDKTIHKIISIPNIKNTDTNIVLRTLKEDMRITFPQLDFPVGVRNNE